MDRAIKFNGSNINKMIESTTLKQPVNEVFSGTACEIVKKEAVHTYIIMPLNKSAYTVFDRDVLMDGFNAEPEENGPDVTECDAVVAHIKNNNGTDWTWNFEEPDLEKPAEFTGSLKGCIRDLVQRLNKENGQENKYTVIARIYNMMEPDKLQNVLASATAFPAAEFLSKQGIELETSSQRFLSENMDSNWRLTDPRFQTVYFVVKDTDPDRPVDHEVEYEKQHELVENMIGNLKVKCWTVSVERCYIEGIQLVIKNRLKEFEGDAVRAVKELFGDRYSSVCTALATIANNNEEDIMKKLDLSLVKINSVFSLMGFARSYNNGRYENIPSDDREANAIALDEMNDQEDHFYETIWDCLAEREANIVWNSVVNPLITRHGWKMSGMDNIGSDTIEEDVPVSPDMVKSIAGQKTQETNGDIGNGPGKLLFGEGDSNWTTLEWQSAMSIGQRTAKSIEISERMFGETELNFLVKDGMDPLKLYEMRTLWKSHPLLAIAYDMDFAAQFVSDYMGKCGITAGEVEGGEYGTLMFTSTFTNGSRLFADDQGRIFLNLKFGGDNEYPEDISTNNATLLSWCMETFDPKNNSKASNFYTNIRNYLQIALNRWADVRSSIKMAGADEAQVLERFTTLMETFPERKSPTDNIVAKFNNYVFAGYNPMENLNKCIENLSKGNVTVV